MQVLALLVIVKIIENISVVDLKHRKPNTDLVKLSCDRPNGRLDLSSNKVDFENTNIYLIR